MKAVISTTWDDQYLFFLPIVSWCWKRLGVGVFLVTPKEEDYRSRSEANNLVINTWIDHGSDSLNRRWQTVEAPENKLPTYIQCSRLYAAAECDDSEVLVTSDVDMLVFKNEFVLRHGLFNLGHDLVPKEQLPMCYTWGLASDWKRVFGIGSKTLQQCLDEQLAHEECENMRGNLWCRDQEILANKFNEMPSASVRKFNRARPGTQFATNRVDRDDVNWRSYLGPNLLDAHLWRPGYTDQSFANIMELLIAQYPSEDFTWFKNYRDEYVRISGVATS